MTMIFPDKSKGRMLFGVQTLTIQTILLLEIDRIRTLFRLDSLVSVMRASIIEGVLNLVRI